MPKQKIAKQELKIVSKPPALATDGSGIHMNDNGDAEIVFFQITSKKDGYVEAQGVSSIRMRINELKIFYDLLTKAISNYEDKQKPKT